MRLLADEIFSLIKGKICKLHIASCLLNTIISGETIFQMKTMYNLIDTLPFSRQSFWVRFLHAHDMNQLFEPLRMKVENERE